MLTANRFFSRQPLARTIAAFLAVCGLTVSTVALVSPTALARIVGIPIEIDPRSNVISPGQALLCDVKLTAASNVTITSNPPGMVSYSGYANATDTVSASTSPSASGSITIYLTTNGVNYATSTVWAGNR